MKNISLIERFENSSVQNVETFNTIFKQTPITGFPLDLNVEIREISKGDERKIIVGDETILLKIIQTGPKAKIPKKFVDISILKKVPSAQKKELPDIFLKLSPSEFMVHQALSILGCVDGIEQLSKQICIHRKTISQAIKNLSAVGMVHTERVWTGGKDVLRLRLTQHPANDSMVLQ